MTSADDSPSDAPGGQRQPGNAGGKITAVEESPDEPYEVPGYRTEVTLWKRRP